MKTAQQIAQHISDDFMLDLDGRVALAHAIKEALTAYADERMKEYREKQFEKDLRAARQIEINSRAEALEEALEAYKKSGTSEEVENRIRALKEKP